MSKMIKRSDGSWLTGDLILPKHQNKILLFLAKKGAMTMSQTNKKIRGENTSTTRAFHALKKKEMIVETGTMKYHGRKFNEYWLSGRGIAYGFLHDVNSETITRNASQYIKDKTIETYLKLHAISHEIANLLDYQMFYHGKLDFKELAHFVASDTNYFGETETLKFLEITNFPEEFYEELKLNLENLKNFLDKISKIKKE
jgi:hypothetical protein